MRTHYLWWFWQKLLGPVPEVIAIISLNGFGDSWWSHTEWYSNFAKKKKAYEKYFEVDALWPWCVEYSISNFQSLLLSNKRISWEVSQGQKRINFKVLSKAFFFITELGYHSEWLHQESPEWFSEVIVITLRNWFEELLPKPSEVMSLHDSRYVKLLKKFYMHV